MVKQVKNQSTEEKILAAAREVFISKGLAGARMQDIADAAGINKALLHYYFRSKENLFDVIFMEAASKIFPRINFIFESDMPLFEKIETFADEYITMVMGNPYLPLFVLNEINRNPQTFFNRMSTEMGFPSPEKFLKQIEREIQNGTIRKISPLQLLLNLISLCLFPFVAKPMFQMRFGLDELQFRQVLEQRKKEVPLFIINSIKK